MSLPNLYFDEAGNTGSNLLDVNQPVFVLASNCFDDNTAANLISVVQTKQASEVKFQTLKKSETGKRKIIQFFKQDEVNPENISTTLIHKGMMGVGQIAEILIEPQYDEVGVNFYENFRNIAYANRLWFCIGGFYGEFELKQVIYNFSQMVKIKDQNSISIFYDHLKELQNRPNKKQYGNIFDEILSSEKFIEVYLKNVNSANLDPVQSGIFSHSVFWGNKFTEGFNIIHDESNTLLASLDNFNRFTNPDIIPLKIGDDERAFQIPLKTRTVTFEDSKNLAQLQISDLVASATSFLAKARENNSIDDFASQLLEIDLDKFLKLHVWPDPDCLKKAKESIKRNQNSAINPINALTAALIRSKS